MKPATILLGVVAFLPACAPLPESETAVLPGHPALGLADVRVLVENDRPVPLQIFATRANMRFLIGEVAPFQRADLMLPLMIMQGRGELRLLAEQFGSTFFQESDPIVVADGRMIKWRLRRGGGAPHWVQ